MSFELDHPAKVKMNEVIINGVDVLGLFVSIEIFENIFIGGVTGSIVIMDNDGISFIEDQNLEFIEDISFSFENISGDQIKFEGQMNGLRNEFTAQQIKMYTIDFTSKSVRNNELVFINKAFRDTLPEEIIGEMMDKLDNTLIRGSFQSQGKPMTFVSGNRKPIDVIRYVLNHAIAFDGSPTYEENLDDSRASGTSGFLCWETLDGYRLSSLTNIFKDNNFSPTHVDYANYLANSPTGGETKIKTIMTYDFPKVGDYFQKARSGAVKSNVVSFDLDTGEMSTIKYEATDGDVTPKLKSEVKSPSRTMVRMFSNEIFNNACQKESKDVGDQSRMYLAQTISRQNTLSDTHGRITIPAHYNMRAGDKIDIKIYKIQYGGTSREPQSKHSGKYLISQVGHHFFRSGYSYTKLALIRDNKTQNQGDAL